MEDLNKQQIILLTLLVSFVTSIATGIVTVSLMDQAPTGFTQTINRVVERTIEKVVSTSTPNSGSVLKETIVVNEGDQIVSAIEKNSNSLVRIYTTGNDNTNQAITLVGIGIVLTDDGIIAADNSVISNDGKYFITTDDSKLHDLSILRSSSDERVALLKIKEASSSLVKFDKVQISDQKLQLGQTVVYIGGDIKNAVATGIVSSINTKEVKTDASSTVTTTKIVSLETTVSSKNLVSGGLLLNLSGELVGIKTDLSNNLFSPTSYITDVLNSYLASIKK